MARHIVPLFQVCLVLLAVSQVTYGQVTDNGDSDVIRKFGVDVPMRDGVTLVADIYRPDTEEGVPTILVRTPYTRSQGKFFIDGQFWASRGFAFVVQDVRGRGDSTGDFEPLAQETNDGYDTQSWIAEQRWSNGRVGTMGGSYAGWTQVLPASLNNPALKAMIPTVTPPDPGRYWPQRNGGPSLAVLEWATVVEGQTLRSVPPEHPAVADIYSSLPLKNMDTKLGFESGFWQDSLANLHNQEFWEGRSYQHRIHKSRSPMLHISGWYDGTLGGSLQNFEIMREQADSVTQRNQYLVIGPWRHWVDDDSKNSSLGAVDFGEASKLNLNDLRQEWFEHYLRGDATEGPKQWPRARLYVMNGNRWLDSDDWPVPGTEFTKFFLAGQGDIAGEGLLSIDAPTGPSDPDRYRYDPGQATPFLWSLSIDSGGPDDYSEVDARPDVLVYETDFPDKDVVICGPVTAELYASSTAVDTDWVARLALVHPSGYVQRLTEGWVRARARNGDFGNDLLTPGSVERYEIDMWGTCVEVKSGYSIRFTVMSAAYPLIARNLNTGGEIESESESVVAEQSIFHDDSFPSAVVLPVLATRE